jgi:glyoxylase-like metal-dependent hydrolase (beta-lactamase superfamily II)
MHERYLSNAYVVAAEEGGDAWFVDSGAPLEPLLEAVERWSLTPRAVLRTHSHSDHVEHEDLLCDRFGIEAVTGDAEAAGLRARSRFTPGHADDHVVFVVNDELLFSGDLLFKDAVGGGDAETVRRSVMEGVMDLPPETWVLPGHTDQTTIGREWEMNPFVVVWRGKQPPLDEPVEVAGEPATLLVWSPDYDGNGKALVRLADGTERIVGGSRVQRS